MNETLQSLQRFLEKSWFENSGLATALIFAWVACTTLLIQANAKPLVYFTVLTIVSFVIFALWMWSRRLPRTKKGKVGFVVSIYCCDDKEMERIKEDFIVPLRQLIELGATGSSFHFIELSQRHAKEINNPNDAEALRRKSRAHFFLYGRVRLRILNGTEHHIIELEGN